jgi:hypothetical protein
MSKNTIFTDTVPFSNTFAPAIKAEIDKHLGPMGLHTIVVGSGLATGTSNDLDLQVELEDVIEHFSSINASMAREALARYLQLHGFETARKGINVFVKVPVGTSAYQVDLEVIYNADKVSKFHQHVIPEGSPYKGIHKQLFLVTLAKKNGFMYSAWEGLYNRTADNKKGELVTNDWDQIAKILLGPEHSGNDLACVESIMQAMPPFHADLTLRAAETDQNWF